MAHVYSGRSIRNSVAAGVRTIEHGNLLDEESAQTMKDTGAFLVPTLVTYEKISQTGRSLGIPESNLRKINIAREKSFEALSIAHRYYNTLQSYGRHPQGAG